MRPKAQVMNPKKAKSKDTDNNTKTANIIDESIEKDTNI